MLRRRFPVAIDSYLPPRLTECWNLLSIFLAAFFLLVLFLPAFFQVRCKQ